MHDRFYFRIVVTLLFLSFCLTAFSQDDWDVPWQVIGDSANMAPKQNVIVTGKISVKGSGEPVSGASISAETFKYFDYSDQSGVYALDFLLAGIE